MMMAVDNLLYHAPDVAARACLLAASCKESCTWLNALPISSFGLRMNGNAVQVAVDLHLGSMICLPHVCCHFGHDVNSLGLHGLSCKRSEGATSPRRVNPLTAEFL